MICAFGLKVIAEGLSEEEIKGLKTMFENMDMDKSGSITYEELKMGLNRHGSKLSETEVKQLMEAVSVIIISHFSLLPFVDLNKNKKMVTFFFFVQADVDGNGTIDYIEFISATMHRHRLERDEHLYKAFQYFDKDGSG